MPFNAKVVLPLPQLMNLLVPGGRDRVPTGMLVVYRPKTGIVMLYEKSSLSPTDNRDYMEYLRVSVGKYIKQRSPDLSQDALSNAVEDALAPVFKYTAKGVDPDKLFEIYSGPRAQVPSADAKAPSGVRPLPRAALPVERQVREGPPVRSTEELAFRQILFTRMVWGMLHETDVYPLELRENLHVASQHPECAGDAAALIQERIDLLAKFKTPVFAKPANDLLAGLQDPEVFADAAGTHYVESSSVAARLACKEAAHVLLIALRSLPLQQLQAIRMPPQLLNQFQRAAKSPSHLTPASKALGTLLKQEAGVDSGQVFETLKRNCAHVPAPQRDEPAAVQPEPEESAMDPFDRMVQELDAQAAAMEPAEHARIFSQECILTAYLDEMLPANDACLSHPGMDAAPMWAKKLDNDPRLAHVAVELIEAHIARMERSHVEGQLKHLNSAMALLLPPAHTWDHEYLPMKTVLNLAASVAYWKDADDGAIENPRSKCKAFAATMKKLGRDADNIIAKLLQNATLLERFEQSPLARARQFQHLAPEYIIPLWLDMMACEQAAALACAAAIDAGADESALNGEVAQPIPMPIPEILVPPAPPVQAEAEDEIKRPMPATIKGAMPRADARVTVLDRDFYEVGQQGPVTREPYVPTNHHDGSKSRKRSRAVKLAIATKNKIWMRAKVGDAQALRLWRLDTYGPDRVYG